MDHSFPTTRFLFVRHAPTLWNEERRYAGSSEVTLAAEAPQYIAALTKRLIETDIEAIYSSPLSRCLITIEPTAEHHSLRVISREDLRERDLGDWEGKSPNELHLTHDGYTFPISAYDGDFRIPNAEPLDHLEHRIRFLLHELREAHPGQTVLVATHAGVIWMLQARIIQNTPRELHWPPNCSITTIVTEDQHYLSAGTEEVFTKK